MSGGGCLVADMRARLAEASAQESWSWSLGAGVLELESWHRSLGAGVLAKTGRYENMSAILSPDG
jgi:hypothetical protein